MLSFRISDEQLRNLRRVCLADGFGSYSELARTAVDELIARRSSSEAATLELEVERLRAQVEVLHRYFNEHVTAAKPAG
jgi:Arc/MetJ-type ribon-helix-helix transcriptional regulator